MTNDQKKDILMLRKQGSSYQQIADALRLTRNQVISFCRRSGLIEHKKAKEDPGRIPYDPAHCRNCGAPIEQKPGRKPIIFCSSKCCQEWWNKHPEAVNRRPTSIYHFTCSCCGKAFTAYGNSHRKYCSHACYIKARFKGGDSHE